MLSKFIRLNMHGFEFELFPIPMNLVSGEGDVEEFILNESQSVRIIS